MNSIIKKSSLILIMLISVISFTNAQSAKTWTVDKDHASINFSVKHFFSAVNGRFQSFDGDLKFETTDLKNSKVSFTIQTSSVNTDNEGRDEHLQTEDFFNSEKFPEIKFESTSFKKVSDTEHIVQGKLTIRDVTKTVNLLLKITGRVDNPWKDTSEILGLSVSTSINRTEYGVGTGSWAATAIVGDNVDIVINMEWDGKK